ncbi:hypothetical protein J1605_011956 [Eschrichtius robustus]|uniref:Nectin-1 n=1 Tax=Eschrichtius robustus TaxID=9764 RepID=A0AB34GIX3_ESCRO|nr:hypothetical protein J1605_011956 [Eschrichtius robustus]
MAIVQVIALPWAHLAREMKSRAEEGVQQGACQRHTETDAWYMFAEWIGGWVDGAMMRQVAKGESTQVQEFPYTPSPREPGRRAGPVPTAIIGGAVGSILLVLAVVGGIVVALRRRRHTFKGDYSTKKHVYGNGYSKAGIPQHHPPMAQNLQYPEDSDDEKKAGPLGGSSYEEEEEEEGGGGEHKVGGPHPKYDEDAKRPYFTVDEAEAHQDGCYGDRTLGYQYDPEQLDLAENMVSQNDGSFISKKEWYV